MFQRLLVGVMVIISASWCGVSVSFAADHWEKILKKQFTSSWGGMRVGAIAEFGGRAYAGVGDLGSSEVWQISRDVCAGQPTIVDVTPSGWKSYTSAVSMAMAVFKGQLYIGNDEGQVFRTLDGSTWFDANFFGSNESVNAMAVFQGHLYVATSSGIYQTWEGSSWLPVVGPWPALHPYLSAVAFTETESLAVYKGQLYAGVGGSGSDDVRIWRTSNGSHWQKFSDSPVPVGSYGHVYGLAPFGGSLYLARLGRPEIWRTNGWAVCSSSSCTGFGPPISTPARSVSRFAERNAKLYLAAQLVGVPPLPGAALLYASTDGKTWSAVPGAPVESADTAGIRAIAASGDRLYVGTIARSGAAEVFVLESVSWHICPSPLASTLDRLHVVQSILVGCSTGGFPCPLLSSAAQKASWALEEIQAAIDAVDVLEAPTELREVREQALGGLSLASGEVEVVLQLIAEMVDREQNEPYLTETLGRVEAALLSLAGAAEYMPSAEEN